MRVSYYNGDYNENMDFCRRCAPSQATANKRYAHLAEDGEVTVGDMHPEYDSWEYNCEDCGKRLGERDE